MMVVVHVDHFIGPSMKILPLRGSGVRLDELNQLLQMIKRKVVVLPVTAASVFLLSFVFIFVTDY